MQTKTKTKKTNTQHNTTNMLRNVSSNFKELEISI